MSWPDPNFWVSLLGGGLIGAIISAAATIFFGPRWVEKLKLRREHSMKLKDEVLKPWLDKYGEYCKISGEYSIDAKKILPYNPRDPDDLGFFKFASEHIRLKYLEIWRSWEDLKDSTFKHNLSVAEFLNDLNVNLTKGTSLQQYHSHARGKMPDEYILAEGLSDSIYRMIEYELVTGHKYPFKGAKIYSVIESDRPYYELRPWNDQVGLRTRDMHEAETMRGLFSELASSVDNEEKVKRLVEAEKKTLPVKRERFEQGLKELIGFIELGNCIKGKCKYCP